MPVFPASTVTRRRLGGGAAPLGLMFRYTTAALSQGDGTNVTLWPDSSGNGRRLTFDGAFNPFPPTFESDAGSLINGRPVVRADAAGEGLVVEFGDWANIVTGDSFSWYWAGKYTIGQAGSALVWGDHHPGGPGQEILLAMDGFGTNDLVIQTTDNLGANPMFVRAAAASGIQVVCFVLDGHGIGGGGGGGEGHIYRNDVELALTSNAVQNYKHDLGSDTIEVISRAGLNTFISDTVELRGYSKAHSRTQVSRVSRELMSILGI